MQILLNGIRFIEETKQKFERHETNQKKEEEEIIST